MAFLTTAQMKTHIYPGVSNSISQGDATLLQDAINAAIVEAKGYCNRFKIEQLFDNIEALPGWVADPILLTHVKSLAKWHFMAVANTNIDYEEALTRYDQAIKWLSAVQSGKVTPVNWPPNVEPEKATYFHLSSNPKRNNHFS